MKVSLFRLQEYATPAHLLLLGLLTEINMFAYINGLICRSLFNNAWILCTILNELGYIFCSVELFDAYNKNYALK